MTDTRSTLLEEAERLIRTRGYAGFSYADLSQAVGITKASIHHHFPTKETLVETALGRYRERYDLAFPEIEKAHSHAVDRIVAYGRLYLASVNEGTGCLCAALAAERDGISPKLADAVTLFFRDHLDWLERIVTEGRGSGEISERLDVAETARLILSSLSGALMVERLLGGARGFEQVLAALRKTLADR
ncbi:TetR/AcrR family transcriptional regulator [Sphingobium sp. CCH11-B1]|uniref:TetR/AcrR family transcriptional regulator n=1 Tax=Sphingobium sp. CCH11-B1 TaxID=1768781 RepID=UPI0018D22AB3|nr:TetR/AcrR family transcriptional regulator [Sphingobium sp. CCH11-B1]